MAAVDEHKSVRLRANFHLASALLLADNPSEAKKALANVLSAEPGEGPGADLVKRLKRNAEILGRSIDLELGQNPADPTPVGRWHDAGIEYNLARFFARKGNHAAKAAAATSADETLTKKQRKATRKLASADADREYAKAVMHLGRTVARGDPEVRAWAQLDPTLDPLRKRPDYLALFPKKPAETEEAPAGKPASDSA